MVNMEFNENIELKGTVYTYSHVPETGVAPSKFIIKRSDRIPFLACFTGLGTIPVRYDSRLCYRLLDTESILKIFIFGSEVRLVPIRKHVYYVGKGILLDENLNILTMLTVSEEFYDYYRGFSELTDDQIRKHFTLVISQQFESNLAHRSLFSKFRREYKKADFNKAFTADPEFESFCRIPIPAFNSIADRKAFIEAKFRQGLPYLLT